MNANTPLKISDIPTYMIDRFRMEERGRSYANNYPYDLLLNVYRRVYYSYPEDVRNGHKEVDPDFVTTILYKEIIDVEEESKAYEQEQRDKYTKKQ